MIYTITVCSLDFDEDYICHYLDHYDKQGADYHFLILHSKKALKEEEVLAKYSAENNSISFLYGDWNSKIAQNIKHLTVSNANLKEDDWLVHADIDEHSEPKSGTLKNKIQEMITNGENACLGLLTDRITENGLLKCIEEHKSLSEQFPLTANIGRRVLRCDTQKIPITRADIMVLGGSHLFAPESKDKAILNSEILTVNHYKWNDKVIEKLQERVATHKGKFYHWIESQRFLNLWGKEQNLKIFSSINQ